jgi:hypothetical protein
MAIGARRGSSPFGRGGVGNLAREPCAASRARASLHTRSSTPTSNRRRCPLAIRITPTTEGTPVSKSVRELLDDAIACEGSDLDAARSMAQQARVLAHTLNDGIGEAEALYRLASIAYRAAHADNAFSVALDARDLARRFAPNS